MNRGQNMDELLTTREAARLFKVSESTIRRWRRKGVLPAVRIGTGKLKNRSVRFRLEDLRQIIQDLMAED